MSKPARPTLSAVLPAKGSAARPEPLPQEGEARATPSNLAPLSTGASKPARIPLTVKVSEPVYKRLREAAHREETDKQDLVDRALDELLTKLGY